MGIEEGLFWAEDGERLFYRFQKGSEEENPLLLLHGHGEHSGRYLKFFTRLGNPTGPIAIFDLRGCGQSSGPRGDVLRFEDYLRDVSSFLHFLSQRYHLHGPLDLFGHSLGGLIATAWAREHPEEVSKLILSSPLFGIPKERFLKKLASLLYRWFPGLVLHNPIRPPYLTHDPEEVERYRRDPLIQRRITVRLAYEMFRYTALFQGGEVPFPFPVYILMSGEDFVVNAEATRQFFLRLNAPQKGLETFPGFFHEIFNEKGQGQAFERLRYYLKL